MKTLKSSTRRAGLLQNTKIRIITILTVFMLMFLPYTAAIASTTTDISDNIEMYPKPDTTDLSEFDLLDDTPATGNIMGSFMAQAAESFLKTYDSVLVIVFKHYAKYMIAIWILLFIVETFFFWMLVSMARKYDRNILAWCFFGIFASPILAVVILLLAGKRTESESKLIV